MSKKNKYDKLDSAWVESEAPPSVEELVTEVPKTPAAPVKKKLISFEQWASRRNVKAHHRGGMKAFCVSPGKLRTEAEWDKIFSKY